MKISKAGKGRDGIHRDSKGLAVQDGMYKTLFKLLEIGCAGYRRRAGDAGRRAVGWEV